ncbi:hypothetical protein BAUCODRAFT_34013 [Baudoinia panamericana UAMH 10762]|uniref:RTA1 domain protein n=1 Tax=Baudoinia panamericana (strain UAMH 10762) TaxID=717646 RepID=M2MYH2_BAUPA|nr:uncharacterized protein BAUCODRAFT_34013 [Baudoinia panamericana UAMH 10762]EMC96638.1 hypothetical protein BAUCODRAFT_34013 [Baudoinia panamericana UAMH 10762]
MSTANGEWSLYPYHPNIPASIFFTALLTLLAFAQIYQSFFRYQWKLFGTTMLWATSVWIAGFICRTISSYHQQNISLFIAQFVLVIMGPPLYAAAEYFILGRLIDYLPYHAPIHPGRVFSTFAFLSVCVETITANGASHAASPNQTLAQHKAGLTCIAVGLLLQACVEVVFLSLALTLYRRARRANTLPKRILPVFYVLGITSAMMLVRCIIRAIEAFETLSCNVGGSDPYCGYVSRHEWVFWIFETSNITLFVILLAIFHPGKYLPGNHKVFLDPTDRTTERLGPGFGKADKRSFIMTLIDPFNFSGIISGRGFAQQRFWEADQPVYNGHELRPMKGGASASVEAA